MTPRTRWWVRLGLLLVVTAALLALAYHLRHILNPLLIALGIAYALNPLVVALSQKRIGRRPIGRTGATVCIFLAFLGVFAGVLAFAVPVVGTEVSHLTRRTAGERIWTAAQLAMATEARQVEATANGTRLHGQPLLPISEPFTDRNGNGRYDPPEPFTDANGNGVFDVGETYEDRNGDGTRDAGDAFDLTHHDWDGNGRWTAELWYVDQNGNGRRDPGYLRSLGSTVSGWLTSLESSLGAERATSVSRIANQAAESAQEHAGDLAATGFSVVGWVGTAVAGSLRAAFLVASVLVLIPFYTFFFMRGLDLAAERAIVYIPAAVRPRAVAILTRIHCIMSAFIRGRAFIALVVSVLAFAGFLLCGVPYALVLGLVTGITILIPFLPIVMAVIPAELLLLADGAGFGPMAGVIVVYTIIQVIEGFYLTPRVLGKEADMHPVTAFVSVFIGAELLGLLGAILAIPLAASVKILFTELLAPELREVAGMGPGTETGQTKAIQRQVRGELIGGGLVPTELDRPRPSAPPAETPAPPATSAAPPADA